MKVYGLNKSGKTFASEMALDDTYGQNTSDGVVLSPPTTNKKKKKKKDKTVGPNHTSKKTVKSKKKETELGEVDNGKKKPNEENMSD